MSLLFNNRNIITKEVISDENGMITIDSIDGYTYLNAIAYNNDQPLNVIRFGDNIYLGYYGGASTPTPDSPVDLLFTAISGATTTVYYISNI